jgi:hypothetical protein
MDGFANHFAFWNRQTLSGIVEPRNGFLIYGEGYFCAFYPIDTISALTGHPLLQGDQPSLTQSASHHYWMLCLKPEKSSKAELGRDPTLGARAWSKKSCQVGGASGKCVRRGITRPASIALCTSNTVDPGKG